MKHYKFVIITTLLALVALIIYPLGVVPLGGYFNNATIPISKGISDFTLGAKNFFSNIKQINSLTKINQDLLAENLALKSANVVCAEVAHQNEILKNELSFSKVDRKEELTPAAITSRSPSGFVQILKVNKGSNDGVKVGKPVISNGYLIGAISEVSGSSSEVFLIGNSRSLIPVVLQDSRGTGLLKGGLEGLIAIEIPVDSQIKIGEQVLTSGLGGDLPASIPIGQVTRIISKESEIFQQVAISSPVNFSKLEVVFIYK